VLSGDLKDLLDMVPEGLDYNFVDTFVLDSKKDKGSILFNCSRYYHRIHFENNSKNFFCQRRLCSFSSIK